MLKRITCTKTYTDLPFAHRQPNHDGHCSLIHGHNWGFTFEFEATELDECGFVIDFGKLKWLKEWIEERFDHTLVLNGDDPWLDYLEFHLVDATDTIGDDQGTGRHADLANIFTLPDCSSEGIGQWLMEEVTALIQVQTKGRVWVRQIIVTEDSKNVATITRTD